MHPHPLKPLPSPLNRAKSCELLPSKRPLFKPSAVAKSSAELLLAFSKDYLSGEGNLIRHMAGLGYTVAHVQIFLGESPSVPSFPKQ